MKIQELPQKTRKVILFAAVILVGAVLFFWWGRNVVETLKTISLPEVPKELQESLQQTKEELISPTFEGLTIPEEVLQELQEYGQNQGQ